MNTNGNIQALLTELGKAHREGVFSNQPALYPWKSAEARVIPMPRRNVHWVWRTVPLAAAAAVALVVAGPSLIHSNRTRDIAKNPAVVSPIGDSLVHDSVPGTVIVASNDDCDFNGDGRVDGLDIQPFTEKARNGELSPQDAQRLAHCLVGA